MVDTPRLDDDQLYDWMSVVGLLMTLPLALDTQLKRDAGINGFEFHVLALLANAPHRALPMSDLAGMAQASPSRLSHAVTRLEQAGWVERRACAEAGRRTAAHLTPAGVAKIRRATPSHMQEVRRLVVDVLSPDQLTALGEAARMVIDAIDPAMRQRIDARNHR